MEQVAAGVKAGTIYSMTILLVIPFVSDRELIFSFFAVFWLFHFIPGVLAVHIGKKTIKSRKDIIISVMTAGVFSSLFFMVLIIVFLQFSIENVPDALFYEELLALMIFLHFVGGLASSVAYALFAGIVYAVVKMVPVQGRKSRRRLRCPQCGRYIKKSWFFCPYCRYVLEEDTRIYDITNITNP